MSSSVFNAVVFPAPDIPVTITSLNEISSLYCVSVRYDSVSQHADDYGSCRFIHTDL